MGVQVHPTNVNMEQTPSQAEVGEGGEAKSVHPSQYSRMPQVQPTSQNVAAGKSGSSFMGFDDIRQPGFWSRAVPAEFIGTFLLVFIACGACYIFVDVQTNRRDERSGSGRNLPYPGGGGGGPYGPPGGGPYGPPGGGPYGPPGAGGSAIVGEYHTVSASVVTLISEVRISLAFGITVASICQAIGHVSGAHLNPAVSFGLIPAGMCSVMKAVIYSAAQILGGIVGAIVLYFATDGYSQQTLGITVVASYSPKEGQKFDDYKYDSNYVASTGYVGAILMEMFITYLLVLVVCGVCDKLRTDVKGSAPLAIGLAVVAGHLMAVTKTGASMNPARTIGPNLMAWIHYKITYVKKEDITADTPNFRAYLGHSRGNAPMNDLWVYMIAPPVGGLLAGLTYRFLFREKPKPQENQ